jgi:diguanylate cyclase (GGDEF)-like protein
MRDGLTEIFNQRKFHEEVEREVTRAERYGRPLSMILFDIDRFKTVNDNYGHLCGDYVLKRVTEKVAQLLRSEQIFARVGGEEFAAILPETNGENAAQLAEKLRLVIAEKPFQYAGLEVPVTSSFGVAELSPAAVTKDALYEAADRALYYSKQNGRDLVTKYDKDLHGGPVATTGEDPS